MFECLYYDKSIIDLSSSQFSVAFKSRAHAHVQCPLFIFFPPSSDLPDPVAVYVCFFGVCGFMCFLLFMCLFVLCSCFNTRTRAFLPSQFRSPLNHAKAYFHASVHSHLFVSCSRVSLSRKRKLPKTLAKNTVIVSEYLSPESRQFVWENCFTI